MQSKLGLICSVLLLITSSCGQPPLQDYHEQIIVFGTTFELTLADVPAATANKLSQEIARKLQAMHNNWTSYHQSVITRINDACHNQQTVNNVPPNVLTLITKGQQLYQDSSGLFNPSIGELLKLWGFYKRELWSSHPPPSDKEINALLATNPSMLDIIVNNDSVRCTNPGVHLDLGGFAKGYAVHMIMVYLAKQGIHSAMVNAGGDLQVMGKHHGLPWQVGLASPFSKQAIAIINTEDGDSVATSGNYARKFNYQGQSYHHIIDPRSGKPAQGLASVTVITKDPTLADAGATALFIAGQQDWQQIAQQMGLDKVLLITADGDIITTTAMRQSLNNFNSYKTNLHKQRHS